MSGNIHCTMYSFSSYLFSKNYHFHCTFSFLNMENIFSCFLFFIDGSGKGRTKWLLFHINSLHNKANLRDLIAATGQVISNWIQIVDFSAFVTLKIDGWPKKTIGHVFYTMSSFVNHFESIGEFKLELQSGNSQFGSILPIFFPVWPWNLMDNIGKQ